jgi:hypothetical protein
VASWDDLKELRLRICDPSGVIALVSVADAATRIAVTSPARQTAYLQADTGEYWTYDLELTTWERVDLELADERLNNLIDLYAVGAAAPKAVRLIMASLGKRMGIVRSQGGAETIQYQTLKDTYDYYKALAGDMEEEVDQDSGASTGRYMRMSRPRIGGDM